MENCKAISSNKVGDDFEVAVVLTKHLLNSVQRRAEKGIMYDRVMIHGGYHYRYSATVIV